MGKTATTGEGDEYDHSDEDAMESACDEGWDEWEDDEAAQSGGGSTGGGGGSGSGDDSDGAGGGPGSGRRGGRDRGELPTAMDARAEVEWSGENRGTRTVHLEGLHLGELQRATGRAREARRKASAARPAASYRATGWTAQLRQLEATKHGREALAKAGFDASDRTRRRWRAGTGGASKARQKEIAAAYDGARMRPVREAMRKARVANKDLTSTMTETLTDRYGTKIRLHNVQSITFKRR